MALTKYDTGKLLACLYKGVVRGWICFQSMINLAT